MSEQLEQVRQIVEKVKAELPGAITAEEQPYGDTVIVIDRAKLHDVMSRLKAEGFDLLLDIGGVDLSKMEHKERFMLVYVLYALDRDIRLRVKTFVPEDNMNLETVTDLWQAANWAEREAFDMYGFNFEGHPNLARILNHREFEGYPLRKDYPIMKGQWATTASDLMPDLENE